MQSRNEAERTFRTNNIRGGSIDKAYYYGGPDRQEVYLRQDSDYIGVHDGNCFDGGRFRARVGR